MLTTWQRNLLVFIGEIGMSDRAIWVMFTIFGLTHINIGLTGPLTIRLTPITGIDGGDPTDGTGVMVAGTQILGTITGTNMDIVAGMDTTQCYGEASGEGTMLELHTLTVEEEAGLLMVTRISR